MDKYKSNKLLSKVENIRKENDTKKPKEEINQEISGLLNKLRDEKIKLVKLTNKSMNRSVNK